MQHCGYTYIKKIYLFNQNSNFSEYPVFLLATSHSYKVENVQGCTKQGKQEGAEREAIGLRQHHTEVSVDLQGHSEAGAGWPFRVVQAETRALGFYIPIAHPHWILAFLGRVGPDAV